jgi:hypothetical protein
MQKVKVSTLDLTNLSDIAAKSGGATYTGAWTAALNATFVSTSCSGNAATATAATNANKLHNAARNDYYQTALYGANTIVQTGTDGSITASGDVTAYSDSKLKENVSSIDNALDKTLKLRGVYYNRIGDDKKTQKIGVIAQEIAKILPEVVQSNETENGSVLSVNYGNITALLIEAIKEQQKQIEDLKETVFKLSSK